MSHSSPPASSNTPEEGAWGRRVVTPVVRQLRQGITPEKVAATIALGLALGIFPILGSTTILCGLVAMRLGLNQPIIQLVNYVAYPLQLVALLPFYRAGETLFGHAHASLSIPLLFAQFRADAWTFFNDYALMALHGVAVWCLVAPVVVVGVYFATRSPLRALARRATNHSAL